MERQNKKNGETSSMFVCVCVCVAKKINDILKNFNWFFILISAK